MTSMALCRWEEDGSQRLSVAETKHLVNLPLDPKLLDTVVAFLYQTLHILFLPPLIGTFACTPMDPDKVRSSTFILQQHAGQVVTAFWHHAACHFTTSCCARGELTVIVCPLAVQPSSHMISRGVSLKVQTKDQVAALLDRATPLHCAALRANPELVELLLAHKAQPLVKSAAGDLPIQLVPLCKGRSAGASLSPFCASVASLTMRFYLCPCSAHVPAFMNAAVGCPCADARPTTRSCAGCPHRWRSIQLRGLQHSSMSDLLPGGRLTPSCPHMQGQPKSAAAVWPQT